MAGVYRYRACALRSGRAGEYLPLVGVRPTIDLENGQFQASLMLPECAPDDPNRANVLSRCRELLNATTPGIMTVLVIRDDVIVGEFLIWTRDPTQGNPVQLNGLLVRSWFDHVAVAGFGAKTGTDQLNLAYRLVRYATQLPLAPAITVANPGVSGNFIAESQYEDGSEFVGQIVKELGDELDGFDWWIDTEWDTSQVLATVKRTARFANPHRGRVLEGRIDVPARTVGQSGIRYGQTEDATRVATDVWMTGTGDGDTQLVAHSLNADLLQSYPPLHHIDSRSSYDQQALLNAQADASAAAARSPEIPTTVQVRADGDLAVGSYAPGDFCPIVVEPTSTYPDGVNRTVRIVGYTLNPPERGGTEFVDVQIHGDAGDFDT